MKDFFISYTRVDEEWAEWIAWTLEEEGYSIVLQKWDIRPGNNFVSEMQAATVDTTQTIAVLSSAYLKANFTEPEWAAAIAQDPKGRQSKLIPVRIDDCHPPGLLQAIVYIDFFDQGPNEAKGRLLSGVRGGRAKPSIAPKFPGISSDRQIVEKPAFPGENSSIKTSVYVPKIKRQFTDLDRQQFLIEVYQAVQTKFQQGVGELRRAHQECEAELDIDGKKAFSCIVYVDGNEKSACRIFLHAMSQKFTIGYVAGRDTYGHGSGSINEMLSIDDDQREMYITAMGMAIHANNVSGFNTKRMKAFEAADYLWRVFADTLER